MRNMFRQQMGVAGALAAALMVLMASTATGQRVTGHWNFDDPDNPYAATVGADGYVWLATPPDFVDQSGDVAFDTCSGFGIPNMPDGDGGVMSFPAFNPDNAFAVWHGMPANGDPNAAYVNQYTIIYDLLIPSDEYGQWMSLWQTANCNTNDGDFYVRYDGAIGTWGEYHGQLLPDTWHRVVAAVDLAADPPRIDKYIDGVLVGTQGASGLDGTHSLYTVGHGVPTLLIADESNDTAGGYLNAFQIRDYAMTEVEVTAMGGVSNAGIPIGSGVAGSWDFDNPADGLAATVGNDLQHWNPYDFGCAIGECTEDLTATTEFGPASDWGLPDLQDGTANVMRFDAPIPCTGYMFPHGAEANGGGTRVNDYTIIVDVYFTGDDYFNPPEGHDPNWTPVYQAHETNEDDALLWINIPDASLGDDGNYEGTTLWCMEDQWMRIVAAVRGSHPTGTKVTKYVLYANDSHVGPVTQDEGPGGDWEDQSALTEFDTCSSFGIPLMPDGDGGVMQFPAFNPANGYAVWHGLSGNGGGYYVNEYTIIYDLLIPSGDIDGDGDNEHDSWLSLWQTNYCSWNDGDFFYSPDNNGIGISGDYEGVIQPDTWHRVVFSVDSAGPPSRVNKYIDGVNVGWTALDGFEGRWTLYPDEDGVPTLLLTDDTEDTAAGYLNSFQIRDYAMTDTEVAALGGVSNAGIPTGTGVTGSWDFDDPEHGLAATVGNDLEFWNRLAFGQCGEGVDDKRALRTDEEVGEDVLLMFSEGSGTVDWAYTHRGFCSSLQVRDYVMTEEEVIALGGPRAAGIPRPPGCDADVDGDGDTDLTDLAALLAAYGSFEGDPDYNPNADFEPDGDVDLADLGFLLADYGCEP